MSSMPPTCKQRNEDVPSSRCGEEQGKDPCHYSGCSIDDPEACEAAQ